MIFLLPTGFDAALLFVVPGHFESPRVGTGVTEWTGAMTVWRQPRDRQMKIDPVASGLARAGARSAPKTGE
ncbi:hypothetical protein [Pseudomonas sp. MWU13-2100]|uniref:hypothetical protein n=1 Tax=Pseudomonas sp. MWU13-2100 TaxID=2935075 RepID=UPI00200DE1FB|nr:hypothetical protein [Pseudomonas sp. MWU13-2100]